MSVNRQKGTRARKGNRRSHHATAQRHLTSCPQCKARIPSHMVCPECGYYRGRKVVQIESIRERKQRKEKEHDAKEKGKPTPVAEKKKESK